MTASGPEPADVSAGGPGDAPVHDFTLDAFQRRAIDALDRGESVLVAAPTGSGKTVVAEHAVALALSGGGKAFYTTPIKALSNQKYHDLARRHGADRVGLLTGDNAINGDAPVVVMTTEVLRNMIYARSPALHDLRFVVLDEVHYLQDAYRGPVWEEVIIHLPPEVRLVCLSATVSNAPELADWIATVRGPTTTVVETERPVELVNLYAVHDRSMERLAVFPTLVDGQPNPQGQRYDVQPVAPGQVRGRRRWSTPRRTEVIELLASRDLLPAIYFIFSRAACEDAMHDCIQAGVHLTGAEERVAIRAIVERHTAGLGDDDLAVLSYDAWAHHLELGVAAHHAGMVPPFKEAVEECFATGLVKVVFATETLALGINMPARTVVIEKLTKFTGERHEFLKPGEYTQLTGRAGRRGIDDIGHAVVLWSPFAPFADVAALAASRTFVLTSSFRPTYNMAANLVRRYPPELAHRLLNQSFAQYQADRAVVRLETRLVAREEALTTLQDDAWCELGSVTDYLQLVEAERRGARRARETRNDEIEAGLSRVKPGDVVRLHGGKNAGRVAVLSVAHRKGGAVRLRVVSENRRVLNLGTADFAEPPDVEGTIRLPTPFTPHSTSFQRDVAEALHRFPKGAKTVTTDRARGATARRAAAPADGEPPAMAAWEHPVADCPDRDRHLRAARQVQRASREIADLRAQIATHTESLALAFDRVLQLLEAWGYLDGWRLTARGEELVHLYHECDLLIAEAIEVGLFDDLDAASVAGLASCFTYEHRSQLPPPAPWFPSPKVRDRVAQLAQLAADLREDEAAARLSLTRVPDPTFFALAHAWAVGESLVDVLEEEDLSGGDFVRNIRQLIDLLRQIADAAPVPATARAARDAADALFHGVVAASSAVAEQQPGQLEQPEPGPAGRDRAEPALEGPVLRGPAS